MESLDLGTSRSTDLNGKRNLAICLETTKTCQKIDVLNFFILEPFFWRFWLIKNCKGRMWLILTCQALNFLFEETQACDEDLKSTRISTKKSQRWNLPGPPKSHKNSKLNEGYVRKESQTVFWNFQLKKCLGLILASTGDNVIKLPFLCILTLRQIR